MLLGLPGLGGRLEGALAGKLGDEVDVAVGDLLEEVPEVRAGHTGVDEILQRLVAVLRLHTQPDGVGADDAATELFDDVGRGATGHEFSQGSKGGSYYRAKNRQCPIGFSIISVISCFVNGNRNIPKL